MSFECKKCKEDGATDARLIRRGIICYPAYICITCGRLYDLCEDADKIIDKWIFHGDGEDNADDHNSAWGGAGPDCPIMRREAAI